MAQAQAEMAEMRQIFTERAFVTSTALFDTLKLQNSKISAEIIQRYKSMKEFVNISKAARDAIIQRDAEDEAKLAQGIKLAVDKGVIPADVKVEPTTKINVMGKSADAVAAELIKALNGAEQKGCVVVLQGLSGTGKGTTVQKLKETLPKAQTWSNGNVFRSLTLLAATYCEQNDCKLEKALTPVALKSFLGMLTFGKFDGVYDVSIKGLGLDLMVSKVCNTVLKGPKVSKNIPTVAGVTQGEVIAFVANATSILAADGFNVLVEGRAQTLNHLRSPHRFELVLSDDLIIGQRRAAQRVGAMAYGSLKGSGVASDAAVLAAIEAAIKKIAAE